MIVVVYGFEEFSFFNVGEIVFCFKCIIMSNLKCCNVGYGFVWVESVEWVFSIVYLLLIEVICFVIN